MSLKFDKFTSIAALLEILMLGKVIGSKGCSHNLVKEFQVEEVTYSAPTPDVIEEDKGGEDLASRWTRLFASIIDTLVLFLFLLPAMYFTGGFEGPMAGEENSVLYNLALGIISLVIFTIINGSLLIREGQTIAKKMLGIRIVTLDSELPNLKGFLTRYSVFFLPGQVPVLGQVFGFINILYIFGPKRRCLHDLVAKTKVIKC